MFIIRAVEEGDYPSLRQLALKYPLLNLPAKATLLRQKIEISLASFKNLIPKAQRNFLFVLCRAGGSKEVIGSSQLLVKAGTPKKPAYSLKIHNINGEKFLQLKTIMDGPSYLGGLILSSEYRGHKAKAGKQLSLIRFLFAGLYPFVFEGIFHAEVAPFLDKEGKNPFFESFIKKYFSLSMKEIDYLTLTNKEKLFSSYPREKILFSSLDQEVQKSLGKPGALSQKAALMLERQNFRFVEEVDPFDGGPYMQANRKDIPVIKNIRKVSLYRFGLKHHSFSLAKRAEHSSGINTKKDIKEPVASASPVKSGATLKGKWLFICDKDSSLKGGVLEGELRGHELFIAPEMFAVFGLKPGQTVFTSPF